MTTHVFFDQDSMNIGHYLGNNSNNNNDQQIGHGGDPEETFFRGTKWQRGMGGGIRGAGAFRSGLASIGRFLMPIVSNIGESARSEAASALSKVASDVTEGKSIKEALKTQGTTALESMGERLQQCGRGKKRKGKRKKVLAEISMRELQSTESPKPAEPLVTGPNPIKMYAPSTTKKRKRDYLDI